ncbi:MAG TPA: DUF2752 domain-containing protein [Actinomycetes bacterium]|nr:DUF2752 domain-containing protein [Actinomycetes bacterium]
MTPATDTGGPAAQSSSWSSGSPSRSSLRWVWPGAALLGVGLVALRDPNAPGSYGFCPLNALTGLDCPFCGGLRGTYALAHGDVLGALDHNLLLPLYLVVLGGFVAAVVRRVPPAESDARSRRRALLWAFVAVTAVFFVIRNLPWFPYLDARA